MSTDIFVKRILARGDYVPKSAQACDGSRLLLFESSRQVDSA